MTLQRTALALLAAATAALAACDKPKDRTPPPAETGAAATPAAPAARQPNPVTWNEAAGQFEINGKPIRTARLWTFRDSTDGFVLAGGELSLAPNGLRVVNRAFDPILLSPKGLNIDGSRNTLVLIRLTRTKAGGKWSGALFYYTPNHATSEEYRDNPADPADIAVGETVTLVYDMANPAAGGDDWVTSTIDQLRFDSDDEAGGEFVIHQIAVGENPDPAALAPPAAG